jgi:acetyl esterase/lipase
MAVLVLAMAPLSVATAKTSAPASAAALTVTSNVSYGPSKLDVYFYGAKKGPLRPAIVFVHGGGWTHGSKTQTSFVAAAKDVATAGYVVFAINYPLASATSPGYPMQTNAVGTAVRWVKKHSAQYYVDPDRTGMLGGSAGATLVYTAGLQINAATPGSVRAMVGLSGPTQLWESLQSLQASANPDDPHSEFTLSNMEDFLGCPDGSCTEEMADAASPYSNVNPNCPATDIYNSEGEGVPLDQEYNFLNALIAAGCNAEIVVIPGSQHGFQYWPTAKASVIDFFNRYV